MGAAGAVLVDPEEPYALGMESGTPRRGDRGVKGGWLRSFSAGVYRPEPGAHRAPLRALPVGTGTGRTFELHTLTLRQRRPVRVRACAAVSSTLFMLRVSGFRHAPAQSPFESSLS